MSNEGAEPRFRPFVMPPRSGWPACVHRAVTARRYAPADMTARRPGSPIPGRRCRATTGGPARPGSEACSSPCWRRSPASRCGDCSCGCRPATAARSMTCGSRPGTRRAPRGHPGRPSGGPRRRRRPPPDRGRLGEPRRRPPRHPERPPAASVNAPAPAARPVFRRPMPRMLRSQ
jgi:hypothetical protein